MDGHSAETGKEKVCVCDWSSHSRSVTQFEMLSRRRLIQTSLHWTRITGAWINTAAHLHSGSQLAVLVQTQLLSVPASVQSHFPLSTTCWAGNRLKSRSILQLKKEGEALVEAKCRAKRERWTKKTPNFFSLLQELGYTTHYLNQVEVGKMRDWAQYLCCS